MMSLGVFLGGLGLLLFGAASIWRVSLEEKAGRFSEDR